MIDWSRVRELREEVGADDFHDLLVIFFEELDETTARLGTLPPDSVAEDDIHFLKGCALNLGFADVSAMCSALETTLSARRLTHVEVQRLLQVCAASRAALDADCALAAQNDPAPPQITNSASVSSPVMSR